VFNYGGRALNDLGGILLTEVNQTPNTIINNQEVGLEAAIPLKSA